LDGEVRVEADGVDVEQGCQRSACVLGELHEKFWSNRGGRNDESVRLESAFLR
jgi:hypothetical protein